ncbi:MAG: methyltransferase [Acidobacteria bacterium RIFCSPLOWO2_12_FULL_67_14]|nr:MAG: methyltransferase [Acidobacteria bacterium RIFCSPLOWO2_02_FULL_67_21]OFW36997.1 MAG: methyltransferase [Acidobacteria bacterium RIFCSPLOWO2_12_FULL_67_14]
MDLKAHWETVYRTKRPHEVSWFQREARMSLELIRRIAPEPASAIVDVGGGASTLVDGLLAAGYRRITVLDLSAAALTEARRRLGSASAEVNWVEADILAADLPRAAFDVWHDRAVFHFLTTAGDRARYVAQARLAVKPGGYVLVATFADDGPTRCSGLPVTRYTPVELHGEFGSGFRLVESRREEHVTPAGATQAFVYCLCQVDPAVPSHVAA